MVENLYNILGVSKNASIDEIKSQYRRLALRFHPDKSKSKYAEADFKEISHAYDVLSDPIKRAAYDKESNSKSKERELSQAEPAWKVWSRQLKTMGKELLRLLQKYGQRMNERSSHFQNIREDRIFENNSNTEILSHEMSHFNDDISDWLGTSNFVGENPRPRVKPQRRKNNFEDPWVKASEEDSRLANKIFGVEKPRKKQSQRSYDYGFNMEDVFDL